MALEDILKRVNVPEDVKAEIKKNISEHHQVKHQLKERMKELQAFYSLSDLISKKDITLEKVYEKIVESLPNSWQYPEITYARLVIGEREYRSDNFCESIWKQSAIFRVHRKEIGNLEVGYLEEKPTLDEGPFLKEERLLINAIAERIGHITERKRAEETLHLSNVFLNNILDSSPTSLWVSDEQGTLIRMNQACRNILKLKDEEVVGKYNILKDNILESQGLMPKVKDVFEKGISTRFILSYDTANVKDLKLDKTTSVVLDVSVSPIVDLKGKVTNVIVQHNDITERKHLEEEIRLREESYRTLAENLPGIVYRVHIRKKGHMQFFNSMLATLTGYSEEELKNGEVCSIEPMMVGEDRKIVLGEVNSAIKNNRSFSVEYRIIHKNGTIRNFVERGRPVFDNAGLCYIDGIIQDITDSKQIEEELQKSEFKFRTVSDYAYDWDYWISEEDQIVYMSPSCERITGYSINEFVSNPELLVKIVHPEDLELMTKHIERIHSKEYKGFSDEIAFRIINKNSSIVYLEHFCRQIKDESNKNLGRRVRNRDITERKKIESLLQQTQQNYESFFNSIDEFLFVLDEQGNIIHTNKTVLDRLEYSKEELSGKSVLMVHPEERREEAGKIVFEMLNGEAEFCPVPIITKSGVRIPVETKVTRGIWDDKNVLFGVSKDISKLKLSEEKFSKVFYLNPSACGLSDVETGKYIEVNESFQILFGYNAGEVTGKTAIELGIMTPETRNEILIKADREGRFHNIECALKAKNGDIRNVLLSAENIYIQEKKYRYTVVNDITKRKQAEDALKRSEYLLNETQKISKVGGWEYDVLSLKSIFSEEAYNIYGLPNGYNFSPEEGITYYHKDDRDLVWNTFTEAITKGVSYDIEVRFVNAQGENLWVRTAGKPVIENEKTVKVIGNLIDITERKQIEADRIKLQNLESLGVFAGGIAHDFNNILTSIMGNASLVQLNLQDEKDKICVKRIIDSSQKAALLTRQILTFAAGGNPIKKEIAIREIIENSIRNSIIKPNIKIKSYFNDRSVIKADSDQLTQAIQNIINNSKEAMVDGGEIVISTLDIIEDEKPFIKIEIKDTGIGIKKENINKIFDPYYSTKPKGYEKGSGLGLSVTYSIIKKHGGKISVSSEEGKGTTFEILLPAIKHEIKPVIEEQKILERKQSTQKLNVLIMDDEKLIREILLDLLTSLGHDVTTSNDGEEALKYYAESIKKNDPFDLVILDLIIVGGMGGKATIKKLQEINPGVKAIVSSGYSEDTLSGYKQYGFDAKLGKPYTLKELEQVISEIMEK